MHQRAAVLLGIAAALAAAPIDGAVIASHRGLGAAGHPENSLAALRAAVAAKTEVVEVDLRTTRDGALVLLHDATLKRTTAHRGRLATMTLAEARALDLGGGERIPTLDEALALVRGTGTRLLLDIKADGGARPSEVLAAARRSQAMDRIIVGLRSPKEVPVWRAMESTLPILGFAKRRSDVDDFVAAGAATVRLWPKWILDPKAGCSEGAAPSCVVQQLQQRGVAVWVLADATDAADFARLAATRVDAILTNAPEAAAAFFR